jgi:hypothetical protein
MGTDEKKTRRNLREKLAQPADPSGGQGRNRTTDARIFSPPFKTR